MGGGEFHLAIVVIRTFERDFSFAGAHGLGALEAEALRVAAASGEVVGAVFLLLHGWAIGHLWCDADLDHRAAIALHVHAHALLGHHLFHHFSLRRRHGCHLLLRLGHLLGHFRIAAGVHLAADFPEARFGGLRLGGQAHRPACSEDGNVFDADHGTTFERKKPHFRSGSKICQANTHSTPPLTRNEM